jgi:hypothetical protein
MSTSSNRLSRVSHGRPLSTNRMSRISRVYSRVQHASAVTRDEAFTYALRAAYLHHLLQPRAKRKQFRPASTPTRPLHRSSTSMGNLLQDFVSTGGTGGSLKLPHNFRQSLLDRMQKVLQGTERMPGYNDAAVKRCFAEAYTAFTDKAFQKTIDKERKIEPLVLIFYSAATKAAQKAAVPGDDSWKLLPDRHVALLVRLVIRILKDHGQDRDRPDLTAKLTSLENKLLTNDQNLAVSGLGSDGTSVEVIAPLSYDVKDMPMVLTVARLFEVSEYDAQAAINDNKTI